MTRPTLTRRTRVVLLAVLAAVLVGGTVAYVAQARSTQQEQSATVPPQSQASVAQLASAPRIVFRSTALGPHYGEVAMVSLADPGGPRAYTTRQCDRVFAAGGRTLCLGSNKGLVTTYTADVFTDADGARTGIPLTGSPSRARLSDDGDFSSTTSFVAGDSYAAVSFSTRTVVTRLGDRRSQDLEDFKLLDHGRRIAPKDRNYWGVTFAADDDLFFVTVAYGGVTHLAQGRLSTQSVQTMRTDAECPSLSPDGTRVAYKKRGDRARGDWRLAVLDLATGRETALPETRSVDDQVEWLDNARILYGMPGQGSNAAQTDVWVVNADGSGSPAMLIPKAWSPAVVR